MQDLDSDLTFMGREAGHGPFFLLAPVMADVMWLQSQPWRRWLSISEVLVCGKDSLSFGKSYFGGVLETQPGACFFPMIL